MSEFPVKIDLNDPQTIPFGLWYLVGSGFFLLWKDAGFLTENLLVKPLEIILIQSVLLSMVVAILFYMLLWFWNMFFQKMIGKSPPRDIDRFIYVQAVTFTFGLALVIYAFDVKPLNGFGLLVGVGICLYTALILPFDAR